MKTYIDSLPKDTPRERERYLRARRLFTLFYLGGLRISEVGGNTMGCFFCRRDSDGQERWWLEVLGKGDKEGLVPASAEMMVELGRYRRERGLSALPSRHEETPLVLPLGKSMKPLTRAALHTIVKDIFAGAPDGSSCAATAARDRRICSNRPPPTGYATRPAHTWPTAAPICVPYATTCVTRH